MMKSKVESSVPTQVEENLSYCPPLSPHRIIRKVTIIHCSTSGTGVFLPKEGRTYVTCRVLFDSGVAGIKGFFVVTFVSVAHKLQHLRQI